jgi:bifunctional non-homologous end joining protein LigD
MLASASDRLPRGRGWQLEPKWDGYRALAYVEGGEAELESRSGKSDFSQRFAVLARALPAAVRGRSCVLDGEICALDPQGRARFSLLQRGRGSLVYEVFDLLELDGVPLLDRPLSERRERLRALLDPSCPLVRLTPVLADGEGLLREAGFRGLEGVMAKRLDSRYEQRRSSSWLKVKVRPRQELIVVGYTRGRGKRAELGSLLLALPVAGMLRFAGKVGTGFTETDIADLLARLRPLARPTSPLAEVPRWPRSLRQEVVWVEPRLVVEVAFAEWTHEGRLRAPSFVGVREDKEPEAVRREEPPVAEIRLGRRLLRLSRLDKLFWPEEGISKGDLLAYYRQLAPVLLPHLRDRPFTMVRRPDGIAGKVFFQKRAPSYLPPWIPTWEYQTEGGRAVRAPLVNEEAALLWMVSMGCIDLHTWCSRVDRPGRPDWLVFDLDPGEGVAFARVVETALCIKALLDGLDLRGYPKTSGGDGLHVLVPLARRSSYEATRAFAEHVGRALAQARPDLVSRERSRRRRGVLIDAAQNAAGRTLASVYSVRPRPGAPVSTPLSWEEVTVSLDPRAFTMGVVLERVAARGDLFAPVLRDKQSLAAALRALR